MMRVHVLNAHPGIAVAAPPIQRIVKGVFRGEGIGSALCNVVFIGDARMRSLNGTYLSHPYTTDVLSFPLGDEEGSLEGEIYVNVDQAGRQASTYGVSRGNELRRLVIHGALHLTGYLDGTPSERRRMTRLEDAYLERAASQGVRARRNLRRRRTVSDGRNNRKQV
jgi:rRNA maturation RNase YbeY